MKILSTPPLSPLFAGFSGALAPGLDQDRIEQLLGPNPFARLQAGPPFEFVQQTYDKGSWVYRAQADLGQGGQLYYFKAVREAEVWRVMLGRMFSGRGLKRPLHYPRKFVTMLRAPSEAVISWQAAKFLAQQGVATPEPVALLRRRRQGFREEYLVSKAVPHVNSASLKQYLPRTFGPGSGPFELAVKRRLLEELARFLRRVLALPLHFPDLKVHNVLLQEPVPGRPNFLIMDLNEATETKPADEAVIILERFNRSLPVACGITQTDRLRFLKAFLAAGPDPRDWRELCRAVAERGRAHRKPNPPGA
jgi:hypothetical protein